MTPFSRPQQPTSPHSTSSLRLLWLFGFWWLLVTVCWVLWVLVAISAMPTPFLQTKTKSGKSPQKKTERRTNRDTVKRSSPPRSFFRGRRILGGVYGVFLYFNLCFYIFSSFLKKKKKKKKRKKENRHSNKRKQMCVCVVIIQSNPNEKTN